LRPDRRFAHTGGFRRIGAGSGLHRPLESKWRLCPLGRICTDRGTAARLPPSRSGDQQPVRLPGAPDIVGGEDVGQHRVIEGHQRLDVSQPSPLGGPQALFVCESPRVVDEAQEADQVLAVGIEPVPPRGDSTSLDEDRAEQAGAPELDRRVPVEGDANNLGPGQSLAATGNLEGRVLAERLGVAPDTLRAHDLDDLPFDLEPVAEILVADRRHRHLSATFDEDLGDPRRHRRAAARVPENVDVGRRPRSDAALEGMELHHQPTDETPALLGSEALSELERLRPELPRGGVRRADVDDLAIRGHAQGRRLPVRLALVVTIKVAKCYAAHPCRTWVRIIGQVEGHRGERRDRPAGKAAPALVRHEPQADVARRAG
jgi:hypothetical protein